MTETRVGSLDYKATLVIMHWFIDLQSERAWVPDFMELVLGTADIRLSFKGGNKSLFYLRIVILNFLQ